MSEPTINSSKDASTAPASFAQSRLWFLDRMDPGNVEYHIPLAVRLRGPLDHDALVRALGELSRRHETLRTTFVVEAEQVMQVIHPVKEVSSLQIQTPDSDRTLAEQLTRESRQPFDLTKGPLWRVTLWAETDDVHVLQITLHHIISDGWSLGVLVRELGFFYGNNSSMLDDLDIQYADFAAWQNQQMSEAVLEPKLARWRDRLAGADFTPALHPDHPRAHHRSTAGRTQAFSLDQKLTGQLRELAQHGGGSLYMVLLTGFTAVMQRWSGRDDLVIGTPAANRTRAEIEPLIGFFVNALPLRISTASEPTGAELFEAVRTTSVAALEDQDLPFEKLVQELEPERSLAYTPLFQVMFVLQNAPLGDLTLPGLAVSPVEVDTGTSKFDLTVVLEETPEGISGRLEYASDLFESETITRLTRHFTQALIGLAQYPMRKLSQLSIETEAERTLRKSWEKGPTPRYPNTSLAAVFSSRANEFPTSIALVLGDQHLTYAELDHRANHVACILRDQGVTTDVPVALWSERSFELIVALVGILKAGGAYLALDPTAPPTRLAATIQAANCQLVLTDFERPDVFPESLVTQSLIELGQGWETTPHAAPQTETGPDDLAYISFTSGSTGTPKGVAVPHRAVLRLVHGDVFARFDSEEVFLLMAPLAFDASTFEIWGALLHGGRLVIMPPENPTLEEIGQVVRNERVSTLWLTAGLFNLMVEERLGDLAGVRRILAGGDVLSPIHLAQAIEALPETQFINGYGPTENTTFTCCHRISKTDTENGTIPIGRPIGHTTVQVWDAYQRPCPVGVPGELYTGGAGLAREYIGQPELTDAVFQNHPHVAERRLYRTGDRVRWRGDGTMEFLGRMDRQVKIRGHRIEPGEVESVLARQTQVSSAVVNVQETSTGKRLIGYVAPKLDLATLQNALATELPASHLPAIIVTLDEFPLNANGKVDRSALPAPDPADSSAISGRSTRTATEEILGNLWAQLLDVDTVGSSDDFFSLGGHSLLATQLISRMRQTFAVELPLKIIFEAPILHELADKIDRARQDGATVAPPLIASKRPDILPLSFAQERLWFLNQLEPGNPFYNMPAALDLHGCFDLAAARQVIGELTRRHESLRTVFRASDGHPTQVVLPEIEIPISVQDMSISSPEDRESLVNRAITAEAHRQFDLATGPLLRVSVIRLAADHHILLMTMHHIVSDGWSMGVLTREMGEFYASLTGTEHSTPTPLDFHYVDYAIWQRRWLSGSVFDTQLEYWKKQLEGSPPVLALPSDRPRPAVQSYRGGSQAFQLDATLTENLTALSRESGATLFMTLQSAFAVLLSRMARQSDVLIGTPIANRHRTEVEPLIGFFVNTLVLRNDLNGRPSFRELIERTRRMALDAYAHQDLPFERLVDELQPERDLSRNPIFQVMFALHNTPSEEKVLPELTISDRAAERISAQFDLVLDVWESPAGLKCVLEFATDLFNPETISRVSRHFCTLLESITATPDVPVIQLPWIPADEEKTILEEFNDSAMPYPHDQTLQQLISAQAQLTPDAIAGIHQDNSLTYRQLEQKANQLAHQLIQLNIKPGEFVGLLDERGLDFLVGLVAILKAGAAFIPIDPGYPAERVRHMISDSELAILLTRSKIVERCRPTESAKSLQHLVLFDEGVHSPPAAESISTTNLSTWSTQPDTDPAIPCGADGPAYMLYTSGSTGLPKGAVIRHNGAVNHIYGQFRELKFHSGSAFLQSAPSSSDISVWQFLAPLLIGGRTVIADFEIVCEAPRLFELVRDESITLFEFVPVVLKEFLDHAAALGQAGQLPALEFGMVTGEAVPVALINQWFEVYPMLPLANAYGPTEAADDICQALITAPLPPQTPTVPIGRTLPNLTLYVLDDDLQLVPIGVPGEICVSGVGVGAGYWRNPEKTQAAFVPNPFANEIRGETIYRTGDLGRWLPDGNLEMLGRLDQQVKLRGFRIELGEIESMLGQHTGVAETVAQITADKNNESRLIAWVTPDDASGALRAQLERLQDDQVSLWQDLHEDSYRETLTYADNDPTFNVIGWDSNYTRQPLSETEMHEYVDHTVAQVRALKPRRILEIGAGTGLLMFPLARDCEHYLACDLSTVAIDQLRELTRARQGYGGLELRAQQAHDFTAIEPASYDVVMLCSVVQYFPSVTYLTSVIEGAIRSLKPGGAIFLGDVRLRPLLPAFHASVQLYQAGETLNAAGLKRRLQESLKSEQEMAVEPTFFAALRNRFSAISRLEIRPKRATIHNEMTRFRADVTLHINGPAGAPVPADAKVIDWAKDRPTTRTLHEVLQEWQATPDSSHLQITGIANPRVLRELETLAWIETAPEKASVAEFRLSLDELPLEGIEPEDMITLAEELQLAVDLTQLGTDGSYSTVFRTGDPATLPPLDLIPAPDQNQPWRNYANHPLHEKLSRLLVPQLRDFLRERLPSHMIPSDFMVLEAFPQLPNGKIDRNHLPVPDLNRATATEDYIPPANPTEAKLAGIWSTILGLPQIGVTANFFELGGHSLKATQVVSRIRQELKIEIALREMFNEPTIRELAKVIAHRRQAEFVSIPRVPDTTDYPLSPAQMRLWVLARMEGALVAYNMPVSLELNGRLDQTAIEQAFTGLIQRHESLRTTLPEINGHPRQRVHGHPLGGYEFVDLSTAADPETEAREVALADALTPFDLSGGPLMRLTLAKITPERHALLFNIHHIVSDDWSMGVLVREFTQRYGALATGKTLSLAPLTIQHRDYSAWHQERLNSPDIIPAREFWHEQLQGTLPILALPTDHPRPAIKTYRGRTHNFVIGAEVTTRLNELARRNRASLFMVLTAAVQVFLHRHSQQQDVIVGTPIAGRNHPDLEEQIGFFINTLPLRAKIDPESDFNTLLGQVRETITGAFDHQDYPFDRLIDELAVERDVTRSPLFDVVVVMQNVDAYELQIDDVTMAPLLDDVGGSKFDLQFNFAESSGHLTSSLVFNTDLFSEERIIRFAEQLQRLLESIVDHPTQAVNRLNLLPSAEQRRILQEFNPACPELPAPSNLVDRFKAQVTRTPEGIATNLPGGPSLTYAELDQRSDQWAQKLIRLGVKSETSVGLFLERGIELVIGMLAILKAGGAYLPLDPVYPAERISFILEDASAPVILTSSRLREQVIGGDAQIVELDASISSENKLLEPISLPQIDSEQAAYIIYTSGSTGTPKGCIVPHQQAVRLFDATDHWFGFNAADVWTWFHSHAFDFSVWEIWGALLFGGRLVIVPHETSRDPEAFLQLLRQEKVTVLNQTPSAFRQLDATDAITSAESDALSLRTVVFGGEALDISSLRGWWARHGDETPKLVNMYGITETTVHVTYRPLSMADLDREQRSVIGEAIPDLTIYLLDEFNQPVPIGVTGEIHVGGAGVARGYLNRPELTSERFVADPFSDNVDSRLYRSGDLARWLPDGDLEYLGRADHQIKIRGFRIELGEIESALDMHPDVKSTVVIAATEVTRDPQLIAYYTSLNSVGIADDSLRQHLRSRLPEYMVPAIFMAIDQIPLTANGKTDRDALPEPRSIVSAGIKSEDTADFADDLESNIAQLWSEALGGKQIGRHDNFFDLGGHSLMIVQVHQKLRTLLQREFTVTLLFKHATVAALADALRQENASSTATTPTRATTATASARERARRQKGARQRRRRGGPDA